MTEPAPNRKHLILDAACRAIARVGAAAVRVHDVAAMRDVVKVALALSGPEA